MADDKDEDFSLDPILGMDEPLARDEDRDHDAEGNLVPAKVARRSRVFGTLPDAVAKKYILDELFKMRLRGDTVADMSREFDRPISTIQKWLARLDKQLREEAKSLESFTLIGEARREFLDTMEFARAMREDSGIEMKDRIAAGKLFHAASKDKATLLAALRLSEGTHIIPVGVDRAAGSDETIKLKQGLQAFIELASMLAPKSQVIDVDYTEAEDEALPGA